MRSRCLTLGPFAAAVLLLSGCSYSYDFHVLVSVLGADGKPLGGATVRLDTMGNEERKLDLEHGVPQGAAEDGVGRFPIDFSVSDAAGEHRGPWYLKVSKEGFEPVVVDIHPDPPVKMSTRDRITLDPRTIILRPKAP